MFWHYGIAYPLQDEHAEACGISTHENKWNLIFDFSDTNSSGQKEQHHGLLDPKEFKAIEKFVEGMDDYPVNPFAIPKSYGGDAEDFDPSQKQHNGETFDIRTTSAADAQKIYEDHQRRQEEEEQKNAQAAEPVQTEEPEVQQDDPFVDQEESQAQTHPQQSKFGDNCLFLVLVNWIKFNASTQNYDSKFMFLCNLNSNTFQNLKRS